MLRVAWKTLNLIRTQALVPGLPGGGSWGAQPRSLLRQAARGYVIRKPAQPRQDDDPPPSTLLKDYQKVPGIEKVDDVVKRLLSLEMANKKEKLKIKQEELLKKIVANPEDTRSLEARIIALYNWSGDL
uniref:Uncharacterized protein n=1 Tax=Nomascus leucogenys TaxID=61853 RepID=A0A2I3GW18_NOMLE